MADCYESKPKSKIKLSPLWYTSEYRERLLEASTYLNSVMSTFDPYKGIYLMFNKIVRCNADEAVTFGEASCKITREEIPQVFSIATIYQTGFETLNDFLENEKEPENEEHCSALQSLVDFVEGMEWSLLEKRLCRKNWNEAEVSVILLHHLLSHLKSKQDNLNQRYILDKYCWKEKFYCPCCLESLTGQFGDTSIGNTEVWHGRIDAMIGDNISITNTEVSGDDKDLTEEDPATSVSSHSNSSAIDEVKKGSVSHKDIHQIVAQTITFSFLQNLKHPDLVPIYPNISINKNKVQFHFYDSVNDILLESLEYDMFYKSGCLEMSVVLALWLVVNHSLFCSGVTQKMKDSSFSADFLKGQDDVKEIYKTKLQYHCRSGKRSEHSTNEYFIPKLMSGSFIKNLLPAKKRKLEISSLGDGDNSV